MPLRTTANELSTQDTRALSGWRRPRSAHLPCLALSSLESGLADERTLATRAASWKYAMGDHPLCVGCNARTVRLCLIWLVMTGLPVTELVELIHHIWGI
jgi:hypothetical protein